MKTKLIVLFSLATCLAVASCQKDSTTPTPPTYPVDGLWIGTFTVDNNPSQAGSYYFSYAVYPDGSILVKTRAADGNNYYSIGKWVLSNSTEFSATLTTTNFNGSQVTQSITAIFSNSGKMTNGIWVDVANASQTGKFSVDRVN